MTTSTVPVTQVSDRLRTELEPPGFVRWILD